MSFINFGFDRQPEQQPGNDLSKGCLVETSLSLPPLEPFGFTLTWNDLSYSVESGKRYFFRTEKSKKTILKTQSGFIRSGTMTALMGPSGAGKTTLLNCISSKITNIDGQINYTTKTKDEPLKISFVMQQDNLFKELTVRETIMIAAKFKLSQMSDGEKMKRVEKIAADLNLDSCLETKILKCSGGQIKRTSTAVELISSPNVLIFDEPTSGLDSTNALTTIQVIKNLLNKSDSSEIRPAIICSIHQPSFEIFSVFDQVYLLSQYGMKIYFDSPSNVTSHLRLLNVQVPDFCNPVDYLLNTSFFDPNSFQAIEQRSKNENNNHVDQKLLVRPVHEVVIASEQNLTFWSAICVLISRNWLLLRKKPTPIFLRFLLFATICFLPLTLFNHTLGTSDGCWTSILGDGDENKSNSVLDFLKPTSSKSSDYLREMKLVNNNLTFILIIVNVTMAINAMITVVAIPAEALVVQKEVFNHWYSINAYIFTKISFVIPFVAAQIVLSVIISFLLTDQYFTFYTISFFILTLFVIGLISELCGIIFGCLFANNVMAATVSTVLYTNFIIFYSGYFTYNETTPPMTKLLLWLSQSKHALEIFVILIYGFNRCPKDGSTFNYKDLNEPRKMMERMFTNLDLNHKDSRIISPALGLPDDFCVSQVINATRDYLGLGGDLDEEYDAIEDNEIEISSAQLSYPMSLLDLGDEDIKLSSICLTIMLACYLILTVICVRRLVKRNL